MILLGTRGYIYTYLWCMWEISGDYINDDNEREYTLLVSITRLLFIWRQISQQKLIYLIYNVD